MTKGMFTREQAMVSVVYADLIFLINMFADYIVLYLTMRFSAAHTKPLRLFLASCLGAFFAAFAECLYLGGLTLLVLLIAVSLTMCRIAFGKRSSRGFFYVVFFFYFSSVILYGGASAMYYLASIAGFAGIEFDGFVSVILLIAISALLFVISSKLCSRAAKIDTNRVRAKIDDGKRTYELELYCDSGNAAKDPFSGKPVTVVSKNSLSPELYSALTGALSGESNEYYNFLKPRVIPVKTVSGTTLLYAFIPKSMYICDSKGNHAVDSIIAIDNRESAFFGKDGIIPGILTETL